MAKESEFVEIAKGAAERILPRSLHIRQGAALLYQITVDNGLKLNVETRIEGDSVILDRPVRGNSAFQTDLCVFEEKRKDLFIPRVVMEFKVRITTHDILTYSAKARKHKQVYPYLRYGVIISGESSVPGRVFTHNEALDFCAVVDHKGTRLSQFLSSLLKAEIKTSRLLEKIFYGKEPTRLFRTEVIIK